MEGLLFYTFFVIFIGLIIYFAIRKPIIAVLILVLFLPFHAFLINYLTYAGNLSDQQSLLLSIWKEMILLILAFRVIVLAVIERKLPFKFFWFDYLILVMFVLSLIVNYSHHIPTFVSLVGIRYDFLMFAVYWVFRGLKISDEDLLKIIKAFFWSGSIVVFFGLLQKFLPADFLMRFGYSGLTEWDPSITSQLPAHFFVHETGTQRLQSFFSGPNSLGSYLVILWGLTLFWLSETRKSQGIIFFGLLALAIPVLAFFTYSRSTWIALLVLLILFVLSLFKKWHTRFLVIVILVCASGLIFLAVPQFSQNFIRPGTSDSGHVIRSAAAVYMMKEHPDGLGAGTAGPSSIRFENSYTEIPPAAYEKIAGYLEKIGYKTNPLSYYLILTGPIVPENWYLQIGVELGVLGLGLFVLILIGIYNCTFWIYKKIRARLHKNFALATILVGISLLIYSFFLHTWSDAPTTILYWLMVGLLFSTNKDITCHGKC